MNMKRTLYSILAVVAAVVVIGLLYGIHLVGKLRSPEFREQVRAEVSHQLGAEVRVQAMDVSLLSGLTLRGVAVANPKPFDGDLFTAESFELRYNLRPLFAGRVEVERLNLRKPTLGLVVDEKGRYNYEALGGERGLAAKTTAPAAEEPRESAGPAAASSRTPLEIVLSEVSVDDALVTMVDEAGANLMKVEDASFTSTIRVAGGVAEGRARADVGTVSVADMFFVRDISAPLEVTAERVRLAPIEGTMAGGKATGGVTVDLEKGFRYSARLGVAGVDLGTLLRDAKSRTAMAGTLQGETTLKGTGPVPHLGAKGHVEVVDCRVEDSRLLELLASLLKVPELARPEFEECRVDFSLEGYGFHTPKVSLKGPRMHVSARGSLNLSSSKLDYDVNLALEEKLLATIPAQELRAAFRVREDGLSAVDFHLYGTTDEPKTDLLATVGRAAAAEVVKDQANKLLKKVFK